MTDLQRRVALFDRFCAKLPQHQRVSQLVAAVDLPQHQHGCVCVSLRNYLYDHPHSLPDRTTANGIVVPDRDGTLQFNILCRAFYAAMNFLPREHVPSWNVPLNVRMKRHDGGKKGVSPRATELPHCDAWVGEDSHNIIMQMYVVGTSEHNCVRYFDPPDDYSDEWLAPRPFDQGQETAARYRPLNFVPKNGQVLLTDIAVVHQTRLEVRPRDFGFRASIDTTFGLEDADLLSCPEIVYTRQYRGTRVGWDVVTGLGQTHLFVFPNRTDEHVDDQGGRVQAVNCKVRQLT